MQLIKSKLQKYINNLFETCGKLTAMQPSLFQLEALRSNFLLALSVEKLDELIAICDLPLKVCRTDYHWKHASVYNNEFGLDAFANNVARMKEILLMAREHARRSQ